MKLSHDELLTKKYRICLSGITEYKSGKLSFRKLMSYVIPASYGIPQDFNYDGNVDDFVNIVDAWAEMICYAYSEDRPLGLNFAKFFEDVIINNRIPVKFPVGDLVLDDILKKFA